MKKGDIVELIEDITFYKKGRRAVVVGEYNKNDVEIRYEGERYYGGDVDLMPKRMLKVVFP